MTEAEFFKSLVEDLDVITFAVALLAVACSLARLFKD